MVPKKATDLISVYAKQKGIPEADAKDMIVGFWRELREQQSSLAYWGFMIRGLGKSRASYKKLDQRLKAALVEKNKYRKDKKNPLYIAAQKELDTVIPIVNSFQVEWKKEKETRKKYFALLAQQQKDGMETKATRGMGKPGKDS
jgi:hypothetical protein